MSNKMPNDHPAKTASVRNKLLLVFVLILVCFIILAFSVQKNRHKSVAYCQTERLPEAIGIDVNKSWLIVEVARSDAEKAKGLSGRSCIESNTGMLFPYDEPGVYCFWMKDMNFPIDMIWLDKDKQVVKIQANVSPDTYPNSFCPEQPAQFVVEFEANYAARQGWQNGTQFSF